MPEQFGDKQHEATPYRRQQAREEGQVVRSADLASAGMLLAAVGMLLYWGESLALYFGRLTQTHLTSVAWREASAESFVSNTNSLLLELGRFVVPVLGLLMLVAWGVNVGQTGLLFLPQKLAFDLTRIDPLRGFQRIFSLTNSARLGFGIFKMIVVASVAAWAVWGERERLLGLSGLAVGPIALFIAQITLWTCFKIGVALLILAILDYGFQYWKHEQDLRMTTQEMREEMKTLQGDPQVIARRRAVQRQLALNRIGSAVPKADVVVTNPTELAIAIQYDHETMETPVVVAKGAGVIAQRIRRLALENGVPVVERKELARALYKQVDIGKPIPAEQYTAMAEVLRYVYQLKGKSLPTARTAA